GVQTCALPICVFVGHALDSEPLLHRTAAYATIDLAEPANRFDRFLEAVDQKAGSPMLDQLRHRTAAVSDHRRAAGHCLNHREAERLVESDQVQQPLGLAERAQALLAADDAAIDHPLPVDERLNFAGIIALVLDQPAQVQAM